MGRSIYHSNLAALLAASTLVIFSMDANAEFFVWRGADAHRQISNVPARGFTADGEIRRSYNPNSIVYQHARMIDALVVREKEIVSERRTQQGIARERA